SEVVILGAIVLATESRATFSCVVVAFPSNESPYPVSRTFRYCNQTLSVARLSAGMGCSGVGYFAPATPPSRGSPATLPFECCAAAPTSAPRAKPSVAHMTPQLLDVTLGSLSYSESRETPRRPH